MKIFVFIVFFGILSGIVDAISENEKETLKVFVNAHKDCTKEMNLTANEIQKIVVHDLSDPTANMKCYYKCFSEHLDKAPQLEGLEQYKKLFDECKEGKPVDNCETAFTVAECVEEKYKAL